MTTVVYRDGIMAGDTCVGRGDMILPELQRKVFRLRGGGLLGWSGNIALMGTVKRLLDESKRTALPKLEGASGILVEANGKIFTIEEDQIVPVHGAPYVALGSGRDFAYAALAMRADARQAVRVAAKLDNGTALPLRWLKL